MEEGGSWNLMYNLSMIEHQNYLDCRLLSLLMSKIFWIISSFQGKNQEVFWKRDVNKKDKKNTQSERSKKQKKEGREERKKKRERGERRKEGKKEEIKKQPVCWVQIRSSQ